MEMTSLLACNDDAYIFRVFCVRLRQRVFFPYNSYSFACQFIVGRAKCLPPQTLVAARMADPANGFQNANAPSVFALRDLNLAESKCVTRQTCKSSIVIFIILGLTMIESHYSDYMVSF